MNPLSIEILKGLIDENELPNRKEVIGMFGGGFKPPTVGHLEVVKRALDENPEMDKMIILVGSGVRDSISQEESVAIWNVYKKYLGNKIEIIPSPPGKAPIGDIYSYAKKNPNKEIYWFIGAREGNEEDFQDIEKRTRSLRKLVYQNVKVKQIVTGGAVSGTKARQALLAGDKEKFIQFLPDIPEVDQIWDMLSDIMAERISFKPEFTKDEVEFIEDEADSEMQPEIDIDLSSNHFFDRLNDPRNYPDIEPFEVENFFDKLADKKDEFIKFLKKYKEVVAKDRETNINIPFMKIANRAIAKTIMRKKNFLSSTPILPLQEGRYDQEVLTQSRFIFNLFKSTLGEPYKSEDFEFEGNIEDIYYDLQLEFIPSDFDTLGPSPYIINAAGDEDSIEVVITYNPDSFPENYNKLNAEIKDALRHELEHVAQYNFSKGVIPRDISDLPIFDYLTTDFEIPAHVQGLYKTAKTKKITLNQAIDDFLEERSEELSAKEEAQIKKIWLDWAKKNLPVAQINENINLKDFTYFETGQGSKYIRKNSTGQLRRIKSYHANTGGTDAGLHGWKPQSMFVNPKFEKEANSVQFLMGKGFKKIALSKTKDGKMVLLIPKDNKWIPATWGDAYPAFTKNKPEYQTKPLAWEYSKEPIMGHHVVDFEIDSNRIIKDWHLGSPVSKIGSLSDEDAKLFKLTEADPKKGTGKKPKGSGRRLYTDEDPSDTVGIKFSTRQDIVDTLNKVSFKNKSHARQSQIINLIHQRVRAALNRTKDPKKKKRLQTAFNYIKKRKEASKEKTKRLQAQKKKSNENIDPKSQAKHKGKSAPFGSAYEPVDEAIGKIGGKGNVGSRYRAIEKRGDKFYYIQDDALGQGIRQQFGPYKTRAQAKKKMDSFPPAQNYRDLTEIGIDLTNYDGQILPGDILRAPKDFPLGGKKLEKSLQLKVIKNSREGVNRYKLTLEDPKTGKRYSVRNYEMDGEYQGKKLPQWGLIRKSKKNIDEGDTYEKMAAKGKKAGNLKQGTVRKRLNIPKGEKVPMYKINKEISRLKKMDKDKDKKGVQLGDKNQKYYKALQLAKTLKSTTNLNENFEGELQPYIDSLTDYMGSNGLTLKPYPSIEFIDDDRENAANIFGRTAYYMPSEQKIVLYVLDRHPKDILRSYAHELIHHHQNLNNTLDHSQTTNTNEDDALDRIEREAYENGNILFRNWEDSIKNEN